MQAPSPTYGMSEKITPEGIIRAVSAPRVSIDLYSHGIRVSRFDSEIRTALISHCVRDLSEEGLERLPGGRFRQVIMRVFTGTNKQRSFFHFHRNQLPQILKLLDRAGVSPHRIEQIEHALYEPTKVEFPLVDARPPRESQVGIIDYLMQPTDPRFAPSKVVPLQTGGGKTYIALHTFRKMGVRSVLVVPGKYIEKWIEDVEGAYGKRKKKLMTVRGMPQLRSLMNIALAGELVADFIIISSKTMAMYLQHYERYGVDDLCPVAPMDFYKVIGAGVRLIDEVHEQFHCNFRQDLYAHLPLTVSLSATLEPDSRFLRRMYETVWPPGTWAPVPAHHCYIAVHALWYRFKSLLGLKWTNFLRQYNHTELEKSIMRKKLVLENYVDMITGIVGDAYVSKREPGQKMIVFVATVSMATIVRDQLASTFRNLVVNRYISEDEYANLHSGDIVVSTLLSAGTAVDIANLRVTLMTTALSSKQSNLQVLGRTRPLKDWPDVTPEFYFLSCSDIEKHALYTKEKREKFEGKILSFSERPTGYVV